MRGKKLILAVSMVVALALVFMVQAQEPTPTEPETQTSIIALVAAWLFYSLLGLFAAVSSGKEDFDAVKFLRGVVWFVIVAGIAIALKIPPAQVTTDWGPVITQVINFLIQTGPFTAAIYGIDKSYKIIIDMKTKIEKLREQAIPSAAPT